LITIESFVDELLSSSTQIEILKALELIKDVGEMDPDEFSRKYGGCIKIKDHPVGTERSVVQNKGLN